MAPQLIYLGLIVFALGISAVKHGQPKTGNHSFGTSLLALAIVLPLLWWGGFFDPLFR